MTKPVELTARVVIIAPIDRTLDYLVPPSLQPSLCIGTRVLVPLGRRMVTGYVTALSSHDHPTGDNSHQEVSLKLKEIHELLDEEPSFDPSDLKFFQWISQYYFASLGEVIRTALPVSMNIRSVKAVRILPEGRQAAEAGLFLSSLEMDVLRELDRCANLPVRTLQSRLGRVIPPSLLEGLETRGFIQTSMLLRKRRGIREHTVQGNSGDIPCEMDSPRPSPFLLTPQQHAAWDKIMAALHKGVFSPFLLHGVTGSGKTEIYIRAMEEAVRMGKEGLLLVPEIALTPQTARMFSARFSDEVAVLHSGLSEGERLRYWWKIRRGEVKVAIGTRSAVFAPFRNLGIVVVDEEHDPSYKQEDRLRYSARDLALVRAQHSDATVILGSATPSLESYHKARTGKFILLELTERIERRPLPPVTIVDMTDPKNREDPESSLSPLMQEALLETFHEGKLCLLFLNRRGYSNTLVCRDCGFLFRCPNCSITLTFHLAKKMLCCHYCDHHTRVPTMCPGCQGTGIRPVGRGTERIEQEIEALLQRARIARMDRDTTRRKGSHERILTEFRDGNIDILIGTQMIAKGHDIPEVTFVGVVFADVSLDLPDFRAAERTFNLLTQVAGRAGRGVWPGRVLIQTFHPDHYCVQAAQRHDFGHFYSHEIVFRKELNYPPFSKLINLMISGTHEADSRQAATALGERARTLLATQKDYRDRIQVIGPSAAPLARLRGRYRFHLFVKSPSARHLHHFTRNLLTAASPVISGKAIRVQVDVDPLQVT